MHDARVSHVLSAILDMYSMQQQQQSDAYDIQLLNLSALVTTNALRRSLSTSTQPSVRLFLPDIVPDGEWQDEDPSVSWWVVVLFVPLALWGIVGNALVCVAIYTDRRLQNVTNYFLFSLAVADLLVCTIVMPLTIVTELNRGEWGMPFWSCMLYVYADVFLCTTSIMHMMVISLDRYLGISQPLKTRNKSRKVVAAKIVVVWLITVLISCPIAIMALLSPENVYVPVSEQAISCMITNRVYMVCGSVFAFLIPFIIMLITYLRTTSLLKEQSRLLQQPFNTSVANGKTDRTLASMQRNGLRRTIASSKKSRSSRRSAPSQKGSESPYLVDGEQVTHPLNPKSSSTETHAGETPKPTPKCSRARSLLLSLAHKAHLSKLTRSAADQELASEEKATRVLGVVFGCFFCCWTPFFFTNFLIGFCGDRCQPPATVMTVALWLGYMSSTLNPLIYTTFNKRFRQAFRRIVTCATCRHNSLDGTQCTKYVNSNFNLNHTTALDRSYAAMNEPSMPAAGATVTRHSSSSSPKKTSQPQQLQPTSTNSTTTMTQQAAARHRSISQPNINNNADDQRQAAAAKRPVMRNPSLNTIEQEEETERPLLLAASPVADDTVELRADVVRVVSKQLHLVCHESCV